MSSKKWIVLGISGVTCSGKTTLINRLHKELRNSFTVHQDDYFLPEDDPRHVKISELNHLNWEIATSMDMNRMRSDIFKLLNTPQIEKDSATPNDKNILILDGFLLYNCKLLSSLCDKKYFITLTKEQCWERRKTRRYNPPDVDGYFDKVVWPEYLKHLDEIKKDIDLYKSITFIDGSKSKEEVFQKVFQDIKKLLC